MMKVFELILTCSSLGFHVVAFLRVTSICTMKILAEYIYSLPIAIDGNANGIVKMQSEPTFLTLPPDSDERYYQPYKKESKKWTPVQQSRQIFMDLNKETTISECEGFCVPVLWLFLKFNSK
jgi:hypothetical protein